MKYEALIARLTLEEKASLMSGSDFWNTRSVERLSIPSMMLTDGPHGLRKQAGRDDNLGLNASVPATCYPTAAGLANSWDEELLMALGERLGEEAASERVSVLLGPGVNIKRNPLCGRNFEYFSEDPYLAGKAGAALIRGIQSNGISACVKHFAANSQELLRMSNDSVLDERTLREIYLPAFETAVKEGGVRCVMTSYNRLNGVYTNENTHLLQDILYGDWGYEGMTVTDWGGNNDRVAALKAGDTLEMPSSHGETDRQIVRAVREGRLDEKLLDERVDTLLDMVFTTRPALGAKSYDRDEHHAFAARSAEETAVLLKNEGGFLPLKPGRSVAVIGGFAKKPRYQGAGSSLINPTRLENALDALRAEGVKIKGYAEGFRRGGGRSRRLLKQAVELAGSADTVLLYLGLDEGGEAEGVDRADLRLPDNQLALLKAVAEVNSSVAVVLSCGCAVETDWDILVPAVIHGYLGGQAGAAGMARLLTGKANPSGKLAETMPVKYSDVPSAAYYPGRETSSEYREGIYVGYRYYSTAGVRVKYPFGHGLSYTRFEYGAFETDGRDVSFTVKNTGNVSGAEVSQLYISAHTGGMFRPKMELKGFARSFLRPGEEKKISLRLDDRTFAVWSVAEKSWVVEPGEYEILVGASCEDIRLRGAVKLDAPPAADPYTAPELEPYRRARVKSVPDAAFAALLGHEPPPARWDRSAPLGFNDAVCQGCYLKGGVGRLLYLALDLYCRGMTAVGRRDKANFMSFIMNMPYRNIGRMSGMLSDAQVYALLELVNRRPGGAGKFLAALRAGKK